MAISQAVSEVATSRQEVLQNRLAPEIRELKEKMKSIVLSTVDKDGIPNVSYAPFIIFNGEYRVLITTVARHARNLQDVPKVSLMLIEDEDQSRQIFARRRLTFDANARLIERNEPEWSATIQALKERQGNVVDDLANMADFKLFSFKPTKGLFVKGFGKAFEVSADDLVNVVHLDKGHEV